MTTPEVDRLRIIAAGEDDWRLFRELRREALALDPDAFGATLEEENRYDEATWRCRLRTGRMAVALLGEVPVGMAGTFEPEPGIDQVISMWVAPTYRGRGIGAALLAHVVEACPATHVIRLWVAESNAVARRGYLRAGFVDTGAVEPIRPGATGLKRQLELFRGGQPLRCG